MLLANLPVEFTYRVQIKLENNDLNPEKLGWKKD